RREETKSPAARLAAPTKGPRELDLPEMSHAVGEAHRAERDDARHLAQRLYHDGLAQDGVAVGPRQKFVRARPYLGHVRLAQRQILDPPPPLLRDAQGRLRRHR